MRRFLPCLAILLFSCGTTSRPDFVIHLVDGNGNNPFPGMCNTGTIRIDVAQSSNAVLTTNGSIAGGAPGALSVVIPSYGLLTQIQVTATCTDGSVSTLIGSTPEFIPVGYGYVNIVLGAPSTCRTLAQPVLTPARIDQQLVRLGANVVIMGGVDASGMPNTTIQGFDTLSLTHAQQPVFFPALTTGFGIGHAVPLDATRILFVSDNLSGIYDASPSATTTFTAVDGLGSGAEAAVVDLLGNGFAVVGGVDGNDAITRISWLSADARTVTTGSLAFARRRPAAVYLQGKLLIAGGQAPGQPLFEIIARGDIGTATAFGPMEQRYAPVLTTDRDHTRAFVALGSTNVDDATLQQTSTYEISSCMVTGCAVTAGPTFADARGEVAVVEHHVGGATQGSDDFETLVIGGSDASTASVLVDRIHVGDDLHFTIVPSGMLRASRSGPGATEIGGGIVLVGAGKDDRDNLLGSLELCFPPALAPISSL